jgi:hypothetical protein
MQSVFLPIQSATQMLQAMLISLQPNEVLQLFSTSSVGTLILIRHLFHPQHAAAMMTHVTGLC